MDALARRGMVGPYMPASFLTVGVRASDADLRDAVSEVCRASETGPAPAGALRSAFPKGDALLLLELEEQEPESGSAPRSARWSLRQLRRGEARVRSIIFHLASRFGEVTFCHQRRPGPLSVDRPAEGASTESGLAELLAPDSALPEGKLVRVSRFRG